MKKMIIAAMVCGSLSSAAFADDGKINFIGTITDDACTVVNNTTTPLTVTLGTVSSQAFNGAGSTAGATMFTLALSSCPDTVNSASVKFDGTSDSNVNTILALTGAGTAGVADGVGIQLADANNNVIPLYTASAAYPLQTGANNLEFVARYYATATAVTAGTANATSNFSIIYN
jgi:major type 1 subunit fimbrin (pilin)